MSWALSTAVRASVKATAPADFSSPISVMISPAMPFVAAAMGWILTMAMSRARRSMKSTSATPSIAGWVLGMQMIVVMPPAAAARLAVSSVSRCSRPGSPANTRMSIRPGASNLPPQSMLSTPAGPASARCAPRLAITPFSMSMPPRSSRPPVGQRSRALIRASGWGISRLAGCVSIMRGLYLLGRFCANA